MKVLSLLVLFCSTIRCHGSIRHQPDRNESLISGGRFAHIREMPFMAHLNASLPTEYRYCGATILNHQALLTAAHCLFDKPEYIRVSIGSTYPYRGLHYYHSNYTIHKSYRYPNLDYDIGVLRTKRKMNIEGVVARAVILPEEGSAVAAGTTVTIAGWGKLVDIVKKFSTFLRTAKLPVLSLAECRDHFRVPASITDRMLCAGELKRGADSVCFGDSGGPAVTGDKAGDYVQVGITTGTSDCGRDGTPSLFTDVSKLRDWIRTEANV